MRYVLIGGLAAALHGSPVTTQDADICPERNAENLARLAAALRELHARIRAEGVEDGLPFACDAKFFEMMSMANLVTDAGDVDVAFEPSGTSGYADLARNAVTIDVDGVSVPIASLEDVIRSKTAANRPKDLAALPVLREVLRQLRDRR
ncbi:MAG TPA: hypothetical protein VH054_27485 [Polyangiaceae bacterium]|nr:hypothetical protein [Polyangiaceae bacterium]